MTETPHQSTTVRLCYAGLSLIMFVLAFPCLMLTMFLMKAPWDYLTATQALYTIIICLAVFHILFDLAIITWSVSDKTTLRTALAVTCPILAALLGTPTAGMLAYTKSEGGFDSDNPNAALAFSVIFIFIEILHLIFTISLYLTHRYNKSCFGLNNILPCCRCFAGGKAKEDRIHISSAGERGEITIIPSSHLDSVSFHPSQSQLVFGPSHMSPSEVEGQGSRMVSFPFLDNPDAVPPPLPPPPRVERVKRRQDNRSNSDAVASTSTEEQGTTAVVPEEIDLGLSKEQLSETMLSNIFSGNIGEESMRSEDIVDYPQSNIDITSPETGSQ